MKQTIFILFIFVFFSCSDNSKEKLLTGNGIKYWDVVDSPNFARYCYSFSEDGTCKYYYYKGDSCNRNLMYDDDVISENIWRFKDDTTLSIRSIDRKLILLNSDTLLLIKKNNKLLLLKSPCQDN